MVLAQRVELIDHLEARLAPEVVDHSQVGQDVEGESGVVAQSPQRIQHALAGNHDDGLPTHQLRGSGDCVRRQRGDARDDLVGRQSHSSAPLRHT